MTITVYKSIDVDAPILNGTVGSFITVLDACLVNGYGTKAAAGWTKEYSGTNLAAYRMSTVYPATGMYLQVDDTTADRSYFAGFVQMSDVNTGVNKFPDISQSIFSQGLIFKKSSTSDATARPWVIIASNRFVYVFCGSNTTIFNQRISSDGLLMFGDIVSVNPFDRYNCMIWGTPTFNANTFSNMSNGSFRAFNSSDSDPGLFLARDFTGIGSSAYVNKLRDAPHNISSGLTYATFNTQIPSPPGFPDPVTGKMNLFSIHILENSNQGIRGQIPGLYEPYGSVPFDSYEIMNGDGEFSGKQFIVVSIDSTSKAAIQISGDWYS
jgi:hypothetical protein